MQTSPLQYCRELQPRTIDDVFESNHPTLAAVTASSGGMATRAVVVLLLKEVLDFFNTTQTMSDTQVAVTSDLIIEEYPYFQVDDLKLAFRNAMKGHYGEVYNRLDGSVILGWLKKYNAERCARADVISYKEHNEHLLEQKEEGCFYAEYRRLLAEKARSGDKEAQAALRRSDEVMNMMRRKKLQRQKEQLEEFDKKRHERV